MVMRNSYTSSTLCKLLTQNTCIYMNFSVVMDDPKFVVSTRAAKKKSKKPNRIKNNRIVQTGSLWSGFVYREEVWLIT